MTPMLLTSLTQFRVTGSAHAAMDIIAIIDALPKDSSDANLIDSVKYGNGLSQLCAEIARSPKLAANIGNARIERLLLAVMHNRVHTRRIRPASFYMILENGLRDILPGMRHVA